MTDTAQGADGAGQSYQERVRQHFLYVAGDDTTDMPERRDRACEEFAELQQALGGTLEGWMAVGRYVWGRPVGEPAQEMGGTLNTLAALAAWADLDMMACAEAELERTKRPEIVAKIRRKRANRHGRGVLPGDDADLITASTAPVPATPPGVPDSVRAAFAAATDSPLFVHDFADPRVSSAPSCQDVNLSFTTPDHITAAFMGNGEAGTIEQARKDATALAAAWNHVRTIIATHPAGQSAGSGAGPLKADGTPYEVLGTTYDGVQVLAPATKSERFTPEEAREAIRKAMPAPDSTRTGDEGTEMLREAVSKALHDNQFLDDWNELVDPVVDAVLAARPAAPEMGCLGPVSAPSTKEG